MKHYLIIRTSSLGDVALSLKLVYAIARSYPDARFTYLMKPTITGVLINPPPNLEAMTADLKDSDRSILALFRLACRLSGEGFDAVIDLQRNWRTRFLTRYLRFFSKAETYTIRKLHIPKADKSLQRKADRIPYPHSDQAIQLFERTFRKARLQPQAPYPLPDTMQDSRITSSEEILLPHMPLLVGFVPFAKNESPTAASIAAVKALLSELLKAFPQVGVLIIGAEEIFSEAPLESSPRYAFLPSNIHFHRELNALRKLRILIGIDSSFLHLAEVVGTKVLYLSEILEDTTTIADHLIEQIHNIISPSEDNSSNS